MVQGTSQGLWLGGSWAGSLMPTQHPPIQPHHLRVAEKATCQDAIRHQSRQEAARRAPQTLQHHQAKAE